MDCCCCRGWDRPDRGPGIRTYHTYFLLMPQNERTQDDAPATRGGEAAAAGDADPDPGRKVGAWVDGFG